MGSFISKVKMIRRLQVLTVIFTIMSPMLTKVSFTRTGCPSPDPEISDCPTSGVSCRPDPKLYGNVPKFNNFIMGTKTSTWESCARVCRGSAQCKYWTYNPNLFFHNCMIFKSCCRTPRINTDLVSGTKLCQGY